MNAVIVHEYTLAEIERAQSLLNRLAADDDFWLTREGQRVGDLIEDLDLRPSHNNLEGLQS